MYKFWTEDVVVSVPEYVLEQRCGMFQRQSMLWSKDKGVSASGFSWEQVTGVGEAGKVTVLSGRPVSL